VFWGLSVKDLTIIRNCDNTSAIFFVYFLLFYFHVYSHLLYYYDSLSSVPLCNWLYAVVKHFNK
jgi:hypothetical protein